MRWFLGCGILLMACMMVDADRSFTVGKGVFLKDGQPFRYISGTIHYWRQLPQYWEDTFNKMRAAGLNTLSTYINWNLHEPEPLQYTFDGGLDIRKYFQLAQKYGLLVVLRPGPFIDAEVDMGGLPYWLLRFNSTMKLRTSDPSYLQYVERWYRKVLPMLKDLTYANGGPIITVQIENEYGSYPACDKVYQNFLKKLVLEIMGPNIVLYTTDGPLDYMLSCGRVDGTLTTCDFGAGDNATNEFAELRKFNIDGPLVNSEFYPGWIDHWGEAWNTVSTADVLATAEQMLQMNASFNVYPIRGGSNFGFSVGSNMGSEFQPVTTSYDFDAPLSEAGDPRDKYYQFRQLVGKYSPLPPGPVPQPSPKAAYGKVQMSFAGTVFDNLKQLCPDGPVVSPTPLSFELLEHGYGFVLYRTVVKERHRDPAILNVPNLADRAIVFVDQKPVGILSRSANIFTIAIYVQPGQTLDILVHNEGRICYGTGINDMKGILGNVTIDKTVLTDWEMFPLDLPNYPSSELVPLGFEQKELYSKSHTRISGFYSGSFLVDQILDTFLNMDGWTNGYAFVNGFNLGRYWPVQGPQITLYVPGAILKQGVNVVEIFELEHAPCVLDFQCHIEFVDTAVLNGTVPVQPKKVKSSPKPWGLKRKWM
ncbi:beta-galactosidase-like [Paramacrobiotus metropolitanus]|uniref:beta-galactosidase-like n=1 Tax=Paramacrobiotus metropolitanus TaxID=2943436 RepID=UPI0024459280|nr:beta-galactosidase-like [Paramacrobiotus metropolitanus]XP_055334429.1 beta-galactosidase-like [Paramacrobiotus metropolitanus]